MDMTLSNSTSFPVNFHVHREVVNEDGLWNPTDDGSLEGGLQINVYGRKANFLKLADAIRAFAETKSSEDADFHQHFEGLWSVDRRTRLHVTLRKDDLGNSIHSESFPHDRVS
jgi:hypothetical protein